jgi:hypothetical protein
MLDAYTTELETMLPQLDITDAELVRARTHVARRILGETHGALDETGIALMTDLAMRVATLGPKARERGAAPSTVEPGDELDGSDESSDEDDPANQYQFPHVDLVCTNCRVVYTYRTVHHMGFADWEDVVCEKCHGPIGHVRHDEGSMTLLGTRPYVPGEEGTLRVDIGRKERPWDSITSGFAPLPPESQEKRDTDASRSPKGE